MSARSDRTPTAERERGQPPAAGAELLEQYRRVRAFSAALTEPLEPEDQVVQAMPDASPTKWHLAHTTWFFETFVLKPHDAGYVEAHPEYAYLFNSYYNAAGPQFSRPDRGLITRPTVKQTWAYRKYVDAAVERLIRSADDALLETLVPLVSLGCHHEQQHQELILTDVKNLLSRNPLQPVYRRLDARTGEAPPLAWQPFEAGLYEIGFDPQADALGGADPRFHYDNEGPRHPEYLPAFELASRPVTCGEWLEFMADGGYERSELWLSAGWKTVQAESWRAPLYWHEDGSGWSAFTLGGRRPIDPHEPVCHVSYYEADAYARWAEAILPAEAMWEVAARSALGPSADGANLAEAERFHPAPLDAADEPPFARLYGDVWEWTQSPYVAYPGYRPAAGALGEYNGKFMADQWVLRGGSCATSASHLRASYRNFWPAPTRFQFTGLRLARLS